jgi:hypothetical protein
MVIREMDDYNAELFESLPLPPEGMSFSRLATYSYSFKIYEDCRSKLLEFIKTSNISLEKVEIATKNFISIRKICKSRLGVLNELNRIEKFIELSKSRGDDYWKLREEIILSYDYIPNQKPSKWDDYDFEYLWLELSAKLDVTNLKDEEIKFKSLIDNLLQSEEL